MQTFVLDKKDCRKPFLPLCVVLRSCYRKLKQIIHAKLKPTSLDNCKALNANGKVNSAHNLPALTGSSTAGTCSFHGCTGPHASHAPVLSGGTTHSDFLLSIFSLCYCEYRISIKIMTLLFVFFFVCMYLYACTTYVMYVRMQVCTYVCIYLRLIFFKPKLIVKHIYFPSETDHDQPTKLSTLSKCVALGKGNVDP